MGPAERIASKMIGLVAGVLLCCPTAISASRQDAPGTTAPVVATPMGMACPPIVPEDDAAFAAIEDRMLIPGQRFAISGIPMPTLMRLGAMQKAGLERKATDWANLCRYTRQNAQIVQAGPRPDVVFLGDSITELWQRAAPDRFGARSIDRGISGQTTPQILLRVYPDVVALRPRVVHIIAGSNDVFGNTGPVSDATIVQNIRAMIDIAQANGIRVVLGAIPPSKGFASKPGIDPSARIVALNTGLRQLAGERGIVFADYHAALRDANGGMAAAYTNDDLHPNRAGYERMRAVTDRALAQATR